MFFTRLKELCDDRGISVYAACTDIGLNRSAVAKWKKGAVPNGNTLDKLSYYFEVSTDYLLGKEKEEAVNSVDSPNALTLRRFVSNYRSENKLSVEEFARKCNLASDYIKKIEAGPIPPTLSLDQVKAISKVTKCPVDSMLLYITDLPGDLCDEARELVASLMVAITELNEKGQKKLLDYAADLVASGRYKEGASAASNKTNVVKFAARNGELTEERLTDEEVAARMASDDLLPDAEL